MYPARQVFLILGLSSSGCAAAEYLLDSGAKVCIYDDIQSERVEKTAKTLEEKGAKRLKKENVMQAVETCDALVISPGIPVDHPLAVAFKRAKKAVIGEMEIAARILKMPIIAITGTNGKTTAVSMITNVLNAGGLESHACGNIGTPALEMRCNQSGVAVMEVSSFQLETVRSLRPHIAVVLNITEDHLSRHYNMENYTFLKAKLLKNSTETEYAVLNFDDPIVRGFAEKTRAKIVWFSVREKVRGAYFENGDLYFLGEKIISKTALLAEGLHNVQNALATIAVAKIMGIENEVIAKSLSDFKGIKHRIERVGQVDGIECINDSKGTNVDATLKAVECMKSETVLLLGGKNKGYDYHKLFAVLKNSIVVHAVLYGENRYELLKSARECGFESFTLCKEFAFAVEIGLKIAKRGQTLLLSPASASFDAFANYEERGDAFVEIIQREQRRWKDEKVAKRQEQEREMEEPTEREENDESFGNGSDIHGENNGEFQERFSEDALETE